MLNSLFWFIQSSNRGLVNIVVIRQKHVYNDLHWEAISVIASLIYSMVSYCRWEYLQTSLHNDESDFDNDSDNGQPDTYARVYSANIISFY